MSKETDIKPNERAESDQAQRSTEETGGAPQYGALLTQEGLLPEETDLPAEHFYG